MLGEMPEALAYARRAMSITEASGAPGMIGLARDNLGRVQFGLGDHRAAIATLEGNVEALQGELANERAGHAGPTSLFSAVWLAFALSELGLFSRALAVAEQAVERAEALGKPYSLFHPYWARAAVHLEKGDHQRAAEAATRGWSARGDIPRLNRRARRVAHAAGRLSMQSELLQWLRRRAAPERLHRPRDMLYLGAAYLCRTPTMRPHDLAGARCGAQVVPARARSPRPPARRHPGLPGQGRSSGESLPRRVDAC
jgi:tetratricopeptide (TPR) repeat protein